MSISPLDRAQAPLQQNPVQQTPTTDPAAIADEIINGDSLPPGFDLDKLAQVGNFSTEYALVNQAKLARLAEALAQPGLSPEDASAIVAEVIRQDPDAMKYWLTPAVVEGTRETGLIDQQGAQDVSIAMSSAYVDNPELQGQFHEMLDRLYMPSDLGGAADAGQIDKMLGLYSNSIHPDQRALREGYARHLLDTYVVGKDSGPESIHAAGIAVSLLTAGDGNPQAVMNVLGRYDSAQIADILAQAQASVETGTIPTDRDLISDVLNTAAQIGEARYQGYPLQEGRSYNDVLDFADKLIGAVATMGVNAKDDPAIVQATGELFLAYASDRPAETVHPGGPYPPGGITRPAEPGLLTRYTSADGDAANTTNLALMVSMGVFHPSAKDIKIGDQTLPEAITGAVNGELNSLLEAARQAEPGSDAQIRAIENFGQLTAGVTGGMAHALNLYSEEIKANKETQEFFADAVGAFAGDLVPQGGNSVGNAVGKLTEGVLGAVTGNPERPDVAAALAMKDFYDTVIEDITGDLNQPDLRNAYRSARSDEILDLQLALNVNLGGHEN